MRGLDELPQALAHKYAVDSSEQVFVTHSAASAMFLLANLLIQPGQEVIMADPIDFLFARSVEHAGGVIRRYALSPPDAVGNSGENRKNDHWSFDIQDVENLINDRTRMLCICNPHIIRWAGSGIAKSSKTYATLQFVMTWSF